MTKDKKFLNHGFQSWQKKLIMQADPEPNIQQVVPKIIHSYPFRFIEPYPHTYLTHAKGRWLNKPLLATLVKEFKAYPQQYYAEAIKNGKITINDNTVEADYLIRNGDRISHQSIRVEPPILDLKVSVVFEDELYLVINKPPSVIVHTGGGNHFNTLQSILTVQMGYKGIHVLHRLDKLTSGLLIFAKDKKQVGVFHEESGKEVMKKMYFARVGGRVEWEKKELSAYIKCLSHKDGVYTVTEEIKEEEWAKQQEKEEKLEEHQPKAENEEQGHKKNKKEKMKGREPDIKDSKTVFKRVWYDPESDSSLLECYPVTGRTHQIRVHLKHLGYPILNDTVYGGRFVGNPIIKHIHYHEDQESKKEGKPGKKVKMGEGLRPEDWDYQNRPWQIMLHSYSYRFGGKEFTTKPPYWAQKQAIYGQKTV